MAEAFSLAPPELGPAGALYERFLREAPDSGDDYLRTEARVRFEPHDEDVLVAPPGLTVSASPAGALLTAPALPRGVVVPGVSHEVVRAFVAALDGNATLAAARSAARLERDAEARLLAATFGIALLRTCAGSGGGRRAQPANAAMTTRPESARRKSISVQFEDQVVRVGADPQDHLADDVDGGEVLGVDGRAAGGARR